MKAYYDQNRELILASKQAKGKEILRGRSIPFGAICPSLFTRKGTVNPVRVFLRVVCELQIMLFASPPAPPQCKLSTLCKLADGLLVGPFIREFCSMHGCYFNILHKCVSTGGPHQTDQSKTGAACSFKLHW